MLARLDGIPGVSESRVDWTGRRFLLRIDESADAERVGAQALDALGEGARRLDEREVAATIASRQAGESWMRAGETLELSRYEAGVLARRHGGEAARAIGLDEESTQKLVALCRVELERAFERSHARRGIEDLPAEFRTAATRILESSADFLTPEQCSALADWLERIAGPRAAQPAPGS